MKNKILRFARTYISYIAVPQKTEGILNLREFKTFFDKNLAEFLDAKISTLKKLTSDTFIHHILDHMRVLALGGGKRGRPYLAYLAYTSEGGNSCEEIIDVLVGLELFHIFALVHDDIIDKAPTRHGIDTIHRYVSSLDRAYMDDYSNAQAVLAGDLLFSFAKESIDKIALLPLRDSVNTLFYEMVDEVVVGQMIDVSMTQKAAVTEEELREKTELKSARYSFVQPLRIGAVLAGKSPQDTDFYKKFGYALGMGFQIQDDMLDIVGDAKKTGKTNFIDIEAGQHTYFTQHIFDSGTTEQKEILKKYFGKRIPLEGRDELHALFQNSGAIKSGVSAVDDYFSNALGLLSASHFNTQSKQAWKSFIETIHTRIS